MRCDRRWHAALKTSGIDVGVRYRAPMMPMGQFTFSIDGTYVLDYELRGVDSTPFPSAAGQRGPLTGAISRWRHYATIDWTRGPWAAATLANNFQGFDPTYADPRGRMFYGAIR